MSDVMVRGLAVSIAAAVLALPSAGQDLIGELEVAKKRAIADGKLTLVIATGSDWDKASDEITKGFLRNKKQLTELAELGVLAHVDFKIYGRSKEELVAQDAAAQSLKSLGVQRFDLLPCMIALDPAGEVRLSRSMRGARCDYVQAARELCVAVQRSLESALDPEDAAAKVKTATSLYEQRKLADAYGVVQEAIAADRTNLAAWELLSRIEEAKMRGSGVAAARAAVALSVGHAIGGVAPKSHASSRWQRLGDLLAGAKSLGEAVYCYRMAAAVDEQNHLALLASAQLCVTANDRAGALRDAHLALKRDAGNPIALEIRSKILPKSLQ